MLKVLIVEDERPIADLVELNLSASGYACTCCYDGLAAADLLEKNLFDLVLLDVMLPGLSGYDLLEQIRPLHIPVIFLTALGTTADRVRGLRAGADDYLVKPFEGGEVIARGQSALRRAGVPCEFHLFEHGLHGLSLCNVDVATPMPPTAPWMELCLTWLGGRFSFEV